MAEYGREAGTRGEWLVCADLVRDQSSCYLLWWLLIARCNKHFKRLFGACFVTQPGQMSSSKRVGGRKANSDGDGSDENNKAEADPPTVTANPLQKFQVMNIDVYYSECLEDPEIEEYVDELDGFAESLSDDGHVEKEVIFGDEMNVNIDVEESVNPSIRTIQWSQHPPGLSRPPEENILRDKPR
ncbi:hypothetical protein T10_10839 [Trichinella papuae]|uniref:Uncharacterized protein n=1 Tax=Trichinella papuae TaxID=268474 RepID=A0A0V1ML54_9BILA|nr:hypothetical protein T10_10839 [Trichinella papuae]